MPGIIGGALMAFTLSLDDYLITVFTKGVQEQTMPLYIYSLVRRGVTPEINALSSILLAGSIGLVGLSLTAQSGGPVYTRAMSVGVGLGLGLYGLLSLPALLAPGGFTAGAMIVDLLLVLGLYLVWRSFGAFREELALTNRSGKILAWFAVVIVAFAAYLSAFLLLS
jgi:ABC-type Fe3+ transport system permease subunit